MKFKREELEDFIKRVESMSSEFSKEEKINQILKMIERCMTEYPEWIDEPGQDRYYATTLVLHKSQMLLVKEGLEKLLGDSK